MRNRAGYMLRIERRRVAVVKLLADVAFVGVVALAITLVNWALK